MTTSKVSWAILHILRSGWLATHEVRRSYFFQTGVHMSESACSARMRELRSERFGAHDVKCRIRMTDEGKRLYEYHVEMEKND